MTAMTWLTMILVLSLVWGGFLVTLFTALRKERKKNPANTGDQRDVLHSDGKT